MQLSSRSLPPRTLRCLLAALPGLLAAFLVATLLFTLGTTAASAQPTFSKAFSPDTIGPGSTTTLTFTMNNSEGGTVMDLAFTDNLPAGMVIATPASASSDCGAGGILSAPDGGGTITFSNGTLGAGVTCTIQVNVTAGLIDDETTTYTNLSGDLTSSAGNSGPATADLTVAKDRPGFTKSFSPNPITPGGTSTLTFTVDNSANPSAVTSLNFSDTLPAGMVVAKPANTSTDCQFPTLTADPGSNSISFFAGGGTPQFPAVGANSTCTVSVDVMVEGGGTFVNVSGELTATVGQNSESSGFATAALRAPREVLTKRFIDDPVAPGETVDLEFTITNFDRVNDATNIAFMDDLDAVVTGLESTSGTLSDVCGAGSEISGTSTLSFTGGSLPPEASCTFSVTLQVPAGAATGTFTNTTTAVTFDRDDQSVTGNMATDDLTINTEPIFTKEFIDDPVGAGGSVTLRFTITNTDATFDLTDIAFTDDLNTAIPGLAANGLVSGQAADPMFDVCGTGSELTVVDPPDIPTNPPTVTPADPTQLIFTGGSLAGGATCTFDVILDVPSGTPGGIYTNTTSTITGTLDSSPVEGDAAADDLVVVDAPTLSKLFVDDPVPAGGTVTLEFTIEVDENSSAAASSIAFSDDLEAVLSGLVATGLPLNNVCNGTGDLTTSDGGMTIDFSGGTLGGGTSCTFSVTLQVPATAVANAYTNTTSEITATVEGIAVTGAPATDVLDVASSLSLEKAFDSETVVRGGTVVLDFTITNDDPDFAAAGIAFTDDLDAFMDGLTATGLPQNDVCGTGSQLSGTSTLSFTGGSLAADASCTFSVTLQVPSDPDLDLGEYTNITSTITGTIDGEAVSGLPATADLVLIEAGNSLMLMKEFLDDPVKPGMEVTLRFTVVFEGTDPVTELAFTDDLDAMLTGAEATDTPQSACGGGTLSGTGLLTLSDGTLPAIGSCTFDVSVLIPADAAEDTYTNTTSTITGVVDDGSDTPVEGDAATADLSVTRPPPPPPPAAGCPRTAMITNYQPKPNDQEFVDISNVGEETIDLDDCSLISFNTQTGLSIGDATVQLSGSLASLETFRVGSAGVGGVDLVWPNSVLRNKNGSLGLINGPPPPGGTPVEDVQDDVTTAVIYLNRKNVFGYNHSIDPGLNPIYDCIYDSFPYTPFADCPGVPVGGMTRAERPLNAADASDWSVAMAEARKAGAAAAAEEAALAAGEEVPSSYELSANYPNPFNPETVIRFGVPESAQVRLVVYDVLGRQVQVLVAGRVAAGWHEVVFAAETLPSGPYLYRLETPGGSFTHRMLLVK